MGSWGMLFIKVKFILLLLIICCAQEEGATNLAPDLVEQIDDTLEEITPPCVLELLSLPLDQAYRTKREEGLRGVRNILWSVGRGGMLAIGGGFSREGFMNEAFIRMTSIEQVCANLLIHIIMHLCYQ